MSVRGCTIGWCIWLSLTSLPVALGTEIVFVKPTDDRWQYPFNSQVGFRDVAPLFGSVEDARFTTFNDRDGILIIAWDTSTLIQTGLPLSSYDVRAVTVTLTHSDPLPGAGSIDWPIDLTVDDWRTFDANKNGSMDGEEFPDSDPGRPIELFGVGFGPMFSPTTWIETSLYVGGTQFTLSPRDPFPFVFQDVTGELVHVENSVSGNFNQNLTTPLCNDQAGICRFTPTPWAIGVPLDYVPGNQFTSFDVEFDINLALSKGRVKQYFQQQLQAGRVFVTATSLKGAFEQVAGNNDFFTSEATEEAGGFPPIPGARAPKLVIDLGTPPDGDFDNNAVVDLIDHAELTACMNGVNTVPPAPTLPCLDAFDFDQDNDVDMADVSQFEDLFRG